MTNVSIPKSVTNITSWAFSYCGNLASVTIPDGVTSIGYGAFYDCTSLTNVVIGIGITNILQETFDGCSSLAAFYFKGNAPIIDTLVFAGDTNAIIYHFAGTSGWGATFGGVPTWNPQAQKSSTRFGVGANQFGFNIVGNSNLVIVVEACTNLSHPSWQPVQTNTLITGTAYFSDSQWTNYPSRYYRIRSP